MTKGLQVRNFGNQTNGDACKNGHSIVRIIASYRFIFQNILIELHYFAPRRNITLTLSVVSQYFNIWSYDVIFEFATKCCDAFHRLHTANAKIL